MLVNQCMTRHPVVIDANLSLPEARKLMVENEIGQLPVVDGQGRLAGLITRSHFAMSLDNLDSLDVWEISGRLNTLTVKNVMLQPGQVVTIDPQATVEQAAKLLSEQGIRSLPVLEGGKVVGIVTTIDLLRSYQEMLSLPTPGVRVTARQKPPELVRLVAAIGAQGWVVMAIGTFPTPNRPNFYDTVVKIPGVSVEQVRALVENLPGQEIVDIRAAG